MEGYDRGGAGGGGEYAFLPTTLPTPTTHDFHPRPTKVRYTPNSLLHVESTVYRKLHEISYLRVYDEQFVLKLCTGKKLLSFIYKVMKEIVVHEA